MIAKYSFNTQYRPASQTQSHLPSLRLLEGGVFEPGEFAPVVIQENGQFRLRFFKWGFEPAWNLAGTERSRLHVMPADLVLKDQKFMLPIRYQRCLIPADGYYLSNKERQYKLTKQQEDAFCFAGIFATQTRPDGSLEHSFGLISTSALGTASKFGLQMPLILSRTLEKAWMNPASSLENLKSILYSKSNLPLSAHPVEELRELNPLDLYPQVAA